MTEVGTTLTDLTNPDNVTQARFELDRAMAASGYAQCSAWAVRWGRAALDALQNPETDIEIDLRSDLKDAHETLNDTERELVDAQDELRALEKEVRAAIKVPRDRAPRHDWANTLADALELAL